VGEGGNREIEGGEKKEGEEIGGKKKIEGSVKKRLDEEQMLQKEMLMNFMLKQRSDVQEKLNLTLLGNMAIKGEGHGRIVVPELMKMVALGKYGTKWFDSVSRHPYWKRRIEETAGYNHNKSKIGSFKSDLAHFKNFDSFIHWYFEKFNGWEKGVEKKYPLGVALTVFFAFLRQRCIRVNTMQLIFQQAKKFLKGQGILRGRGGGRARKAWRLRSALYGSKEC